MTDYIGAALAAEEHRQGMAYGDDADHCGECGAEAHRRMQAACEHDGENIDVGDFGRLPGTLLLCQRCGLVREDWWPLWVPGVALKEAG